TRLQGDWSSDVCSSDLALLLHLVAREVDLEPHEFVHVLADAHVYRDHMDAAREQLQREPYAAPSLWLDPELRGVDDAVARYRERSEERRVGKEGRVRWG